MIRCPQISETQKLTKKRRRHSQEFLAIILYLMCTHDLERLVVSSHDWRETLPNEFF